MSARQQLDWLRALNVAFARTGPPANDAQRKLGERVAGLLPVSDAHLAQEVCRMLVYLGHPTAVTHFVPKMKTAKTQEELLFYGMVLLGHLNTNHMIKQQMKLLII